VSTRQYLAGPGTEAPNLDTTRRRQVLAPQVLALDRIVAGTQKMLSRLIGEPVLGRVRADPGQVEQVLLNLAVNARDAMPDGGQFHIALANVEFGESEASASPGLMPGRYVRLEVSDTGCGIPPETISRIFGAPG
jgi:signal transduction histidine kinase